MAVKLIDNDIAAQLLKQMQHSKWIVLALVPISEASHKENFCARVLKYLQQNKYLNPNVRIVL